MPSHVRYDLDQHRALLKEHMATHPGEDTHSGEGRSTYVPLLMKLVDMYKELEGERELVKERNQVQLFLFFLLPLLVHDLFVAGSTGPALVLGSLLAMAALAKLTNITRYFPTLARSNTVQFTLPEFEKHKSAGDEWYSPSFYTHNRGYRMCLEVCANGFGRCLGTHVSVFAPPNARSL